MPLAVMAKTIQTSIVQPESFGSESVVVPDQAILEQIA